MMAGSANTSIAETVQSSQFQKLTNVFFCMPQGLIGICNSSQLAYAYARLHASAHMPTFSDNICAVPCRVQSVRRLCLCSLCQISQACCQSSTAHAGRMTVQASKQRQLTRHNHSTRAQRHLAVMDRQCIKASCCYTIKNTSLCLSGERCRVLGSTPLPSN